MTPQIAFIGDDHVDYYTPKRPPGMKNRYTRTEMRHRASLMLKRRPGSHEVMILVDPADRARLARRLVRRMDLRVRLDPSLWHGRPSLLAIGPDRDRLSDLGFETRPGREGLHLLLTNPPEDQ